jgi:3D (Asp-Asp-Asp) domain-containing protein
MTAIFRFAAWYCCLLIMCDTMTAESDPSTAWCEPLRPEPWPTAPPLPTPARAGEAPPRERLWMLVPAVITAYQPDVDCAVDAAGRPTHRTSTRVSTDAHPYGIAADPGLLPYGTPVMVPEYLDLRFPDKAWQIDDTGGALRRDAGEIGIVHLDLRYRTVHSAVKTGRRWAEIRVDVTGWSDDQIARLRRAAQQGAKIQRQGAMP